MKRYASCLFCDAFQPVKCRVDTKRRVDTQLLPFDFFTFDQSSYSIDFITKQLKLESSLYERIERAVKLV